MTFRRGTGSVEVELASIQTWAEGIDPVVEGHTAEIGQLRTFKDSTEGKFTVIVWMNGIILALVTGMIVALFAWGLSHITLRVSSDPTSITESHSPQESGVPRRP